MATFSPTASVDSPRVALDDHGIVPPVRGGDDGGSGRQGSPDHRTRLRRARLGLLVALTPVLMLFVSFTSAYVVRQGLPTLDPRTNQMVRDWIPIKLPNLLLANTCVLLLSTVSMELARRQMKREAALSPAGVSPRAFSTTETAFPWLALTILLGICFLTGQWLAWRELAARGFYVCHQPQQLFYLLADGDTCYPFDGWNTCSVCRRRSSAVRPASGYTEHSG